MLTSAQEEGVGGGDLRGMQVGEAPYASELHRITQLYEKISQKVEQLQRTVKEDAGRRQAMGIPWTPKTVEPVKGATLTLAKVSKRRQRLFWGRKRRP